MEDLLWFSGIHWNTPLRDIGWSYVIISGLLMILVHMVTKTFFDK